MKPIYLFLFFLLSSSFLSAAEAEKVETLALGAIAPNFDLPGVDGKRYQLSDFQSARALAVVFTCNHCPDARAARGKLIKLQKDYQSKGVAVIAISGNDDKALLEEEIGYSVYGDSFEDMKAVAKEEGYEFPYLYDGETQSVTKAYGAQATPHVFVFDQARKLRYAGRLDDARRSRKDVGPAYVRQALDAILAGKEVETKSTRAFGCSTKWSWKRENEVKDEKEWSALPVTLENLDTKQAKALAANKTEKLRIINFWSTTCGPCIVEFPELVETMRRFQFRPVDFITVSLDPVAKKDQALKFLKSQRAALAPRLAKSVNEEGRVSNNYLFTEQNLDQLAEAIDPEWSGALPHTVIIAPGGEILWRHTGRFDVVELRRAIMKHFDAVDGE